MFRVTDVTEPKLDPSVDANRYRRTLQNSYADDIVGAYVTRLETDLGVTINQQAITQVIGGGAPQ